jgi:hypothetical protein
MGHLTEDAERLQPFRSGFFGHAGTGDGHCRVAQLRSGAYRYGVRHVDDRLRRLPDRAGRDDLVRQRIDGGHLVAVLQPDIDARAVP